TMSIKLSVLDHMPLGEQTTAAEAVAASLHVAKVAEALGFARFWVSEHHCTSEAGSCAPAVLIASIAARTSSMRLGAGGVMISHHAPITVAEQFATLQALYPGRIDLGVGRGS